MVLPRLAVHRGLVERRGLIDALEVEADDLLRLAILLDLEVVGSEPADHFSGLFIADNDVGEHQVAVHLEGIGGLRIRRAIWRPGPAQPIGIAPTRAHEGDGGESAQVAVDVHPN